MAVTSVQTQKVPKFQKMLKVTLASVQMQAFSPSVYRQVQKHHVQINLAASRTVKERPAVCLGLLAAMWRCGKQGGLTA